MTGVIATIPRIQFFTAQGVPLANGKLYTYLAGTTTPADTFQDEALTDKNENPIPLGSDGSCVIWLDPDKSYKFLLKNKQGVTQPGWPVDDISGATSMVSLAPILATFVKSDVLAAADGGEHVGFTPAGTAPPVTRDMLAKAREWVSILDAGGVADGATVNTAAQVWLGNQGYRRIRFPAGGTKNYLFDNALVQAYSDGFEFDVDDGVTITVPDIGNISPNLKVVRPTRVRLSALNCDYWLAPARGYKAASRPGVLAQSEIDYSAVTPIYPNSGGFSYKWAAWPAGETFTTYSPTSYALDQVVISAPADGRFYYALTTPKLGDEITAQLYNAVDNQILAAMVRTTTGYVGINFDTLADSNPNYFEKYNGSAVVQVPINYPGVNTHASYAAYNSLITIRINSRNNFSVLFNGMEVLSNRTVTGEIIEAGFGIYGLGATSKITIKDPTLTRTKKQGGKQPIRIALFGDSRTAATMPDTWPTWLRAYLDGWNGLRVHEIINYAVAGSSIADAAALCTPTNIANVDIVVIDSGTNDIQALTDEATYYNTLKSMIQTVQGQGKQVVVGIPDMFYGRTVAGTGVGQNTQRYDLGKGIRAKCLRLCADLGVKCVDKMQALGPVVANYVNPDIANSYVSLGLDPIVFDSIHETAFGHQLIGMRYAAAIAGIITAQTTAAFPVTALPADGLRNGWTFAGGAEVPTWERSEDGEVRLQGLFLAGTVANGTVIYVLPEEARPRKTQRLMGMSDANTSLILNIDTNGEISTPNVTGLTAYIGIDDIRFPTRLS